MLGLLAALGTVGILVGVTLTEKSDEPVLRPALEKARLRGLLASARRRPLTRTEAEDGLVLARRLGDARLAAWFEGRVRESKRSN